MLSHFRGHPSFVVSNFMGTVYTAYGGGPPSPVGKVGQKLPLRGSWLASARLRRGVLCGSGKKIRTLHHQSMYRSVWDRRFTIREVTMNSAATKIRNTHSDASSEEAMKS